MSRTGVGERLVVCGLGVAIGFSAFSQGSFYRGQFVTLCTGVVLAVAGQVLLQRQRHRCPRSVFVSCLCWLLLAGWAMLRAGVVGGDIGSAVPTVVMASIVGFAIVSTNGVSKASRETTIYIVVAIGLLVSVSSWAGVAWHRSPYAMPSEGLWRGSSTITYANATAAFLAVPLLLAMWLAMRDPPGRAFVLATWLMAVGWASTLSRGGCISLLVGLAVFVGLVRDRRPLLRLWPVLPATAISMAALLPSLPERAHPHPGLALVGVAAGAFVTLLPASRKSLVPTAIAAFALVAGLVVVSPPALTTAVSRIESTRLNAQSRDRTDLLKATWKEFFSNPLAGVGPGKFRLQYINYAGVPVSAKFTHNEYLQVAAELGLPGLLLVVGGLTSALFACFQGPRTRDSGHVLAGCVLCVFITHSGLDFLWHIPVLPLVMAVCFSALTGLSEPPDRSTANTLHSIASIPLPVDPFDRLPFRG